MSFMRATVVCLLAVALARPAPAGAGTTPQYIWVFLLRDSNSAGAPEATVAYGRRDLGDRPVVGDWNGDGTTTIGVVRPLANRYLEWLLRNENTPGPPDVVVVYGTDRLYDAPL